MDPKTLILPISIIGSGKTTLAKVLREIPRVSFSHIHSDDMPRKFTAKHFHRAVVKAFENSRVVFADKQIKTIIC